MGGWMGERANSRFNDCLQLKKNLRSSCQLQRVAAGHKAQNKNKNKKFKGKKKKV